MGIEISYKVFARLVPGDRGRGDAGVAGRTDPGQTCGL